MHFEFHAYSFRTETIITFIRSRSSRENHARFQTNMGISGQKGPKTQPVEAAHSYMAFIREPPR